MATTAKMTTPKALLARLHSRNMWRKLRRKTMAPRRPVLFPEQYWLAAITALVLVGSIVLVILALR